MKSAQSYIWKIDWDKFYQIKSLHSWRCISKENHSFPTIPSPAVNKKENTILNILRKQ